jgi:hypothetical protein
MTRRPRRNHLLKGAANVFGVEAAELPRTTSDADQQSMKRIDAIHLGYPFAGVRMRRDLLLREGFNVARRHIGTISTMWLASPSWAQRSLPTTSLAASCPGS